jgi:hypothetical protein
MGKTGLPHNTSRYGTLLTVLALSSLSIIPALEAQGKTVRPNELACPVTANLSPEQSRIGDSIRFVFPDGSIPRRISMALVHPEGKDIDVRFTWAGANEPRVPYVNWGKRTGVLVINGTGKTDCFFLGWRETDIPENVPCKEFALVVPESILVKEISFSSLPSEKPQVLCPMPELVREIEQAFEDCKRNPQDMNKTQVLIQLLEKATPRYDCRRSYDSRPVPAWWLGDHDAWRWVDYLLDRVLKDDGDALRVFEKFLASSDGAFAEVWSEEMSEILRNKPLLVLENWTGSEDNRMAVGMARPWPLHGNPEIDHLIEIYRDIAAKEPKYKSACDEIIRILDEKSNK